MKEVKAFETTDGKIFTVKKEAEKHQLEIDRRATLDEMVDEKLFNGMDKSTVVDFILENKDTLFTLLSRRVV